MGGPELNFNLDSRDFLLVYFFSTVGMDACFSDLKRGGPALFILLGLTIGYMTLRNIISVTMAGLLGLHPATGLLVGTVSLIGGHGTTIAWAPTFAENFQIDSALEIGISAATFGLVLASASGGPIAQFLIRSFQITCPSTKPEDQTLTDACPNGMLTTTGTYNAAPSMHLDPMTSSLLNPASTWISTTMTSLGLILWHKQNIKSHQALHDEQGFFVVVANKI